MKGLLGSKLVGWALVGAAVFFIAQAASGPNKNSQKEKNDQAISNEAESSNSSRGGAVESVKNKVEAISFPILAYYNISNYSGTNEGAKLLHTSPKKFSEQLSYFKKNGYTVVSAPTAYKILVGKVNPPKKPVLLTFNDGYADFYDNAWPLLKKYHYPALVFIISNRPGDENFMNWQQLKKIVDGGITIGTQGVSNVTLTKLSISRAKEEMAMSKRDIAGELGINVEYFAYPFGSYNSSITANLDQIGYQAGFTLSGKKASNKISSLIISRRVVEGGITLSEFANLLK